jgi:hypothetical protein
MVGFKENYTIEGQHNIMEDINRIKQLLKW